MALQAYRDSVPWAANQIIWIETRPDRGDETELHVRIHYDFTRITALNHDCYICGKATGDFGRSKDSDRKKSPTLLHPDYATIR
jgi:hypothetical protein